jgi:hypothetical protein
MFGALILVPKGFNQSYGDASYEDKINYYYGQKSLLPQSLHQSCYDKNPSFLAYIDASGLHFNPHDIFKKGGFTSKAITLP